MSLKAKRVAPSARKGLTNPLLEPDNYPARLVQVLDLGPRVNFFDKDKINHEIMLTYELVTEFMLDDKGEQVDDKPLWLSERINMVDLPDDLTTTEIYVDQFRAKSKLVQRARVLDPKGKWDFDLSEMTTLPCVLTVVQKKKGDGTLRNDIGGVTGLMKGMELPALVNPPKVFALDEPDLEVLGSLPDWLQETIKTNLEFKGSALEVALNGGKVKTKTTKTVPDAADTKTVEEKGDNDDDLPW